MAEPMKPAPRILHGCRIAAWLPILLWAAVAPDPVLAQTRGSKEYQVKAAFLFNFAQFVEWPTNAFSGPLAPLVIGILGEDPFGTVLDEIVRGESVNGHPLVVARYHQVEEIKLCHILFINESEKSRLGQYVAALKGRQILTVGDAEDFINQGGMVCFITENNRIRFRVNLNTVKAAKLIISSKLLKAADLVTSGKD